MTNKCKFYKDNNKCFYGKNKIHIGTKNKLDMMEKYIKSWPMKILNSGMGYKGVIFVDAMCGPGEYIYIEELKKEIIKGTSLRVYNILSRYSDNPKMQNAFLMLNDYDEKTIECQMCRIERESKKYYPQKVKVDYSCKDISDYIDYIIKELSKYPDYHILFFYDPYKADVRWKDLEKLFRKENNIRSRIDIIITHFHQNDPGRAIPSGIKKIETRNRYEQTYDMDLELIKKEIYGLKGFKRSKWFRDRMVELMSRYFKVSKNLIAYAPIFNSRDSSVYDIVFFSHSKRAKDLFKSSIHKTIFEQKKQKHAVQQLSLDLYGVNDSNPLIEYNKDSDIFYSIEYYAKYIIENFSGFTKVSTETLDEFLSNHPFIPSKGIKKELDRILKKENVLITQKREEGKNYSFPYLGSC
ncbi:MAG: three-Cys-motif partner protein TcmP [archaeon]